MSNTITCCNCKKEIGTLIYDGGINAGGCIGFIPSYRQKLDYRKASHIFIQSTKSQFGTGNLCKTCAKKAFPEGKAYMVVHRMMGRDICLFAGKEGYGDYFTTKAAAVRVVDERCNQYGRNSHWLEEKSI